MAFVAKDVVSMTLAVGTNGLIGPLVQAQPPTFGVIDAAGENVLWQGGLLVTSITAGSLDKIGAPTTDEVTQFQGKIVEPTSSSPEYQGVVVALYTRDPGAGGSPTATLALVRTSTGLYRECLIANLSVVSGR